MTHGRLLTLAALTVLAISACSKNSEPSAPSVSASTDTASAPPTGLDRPDGSPRIVTEPDGVHIEYRVAGI